MSNSKRLSVPSLSVAAVRPWPAVALLAALTAASMLWGAASRVQAQGCGVGVNPIVCENQKAGSPSSEWQITGAGDSTIQGFATAFSIAPGQTQQFKIDTNASAYTIDIYRMGYYGGFGARLVTTVTPTATLPQNQPNCIDRTVNGTRRLRQLGGLGVMAGTRRRGVGHLLREARAARYRRRQPHLLRRPQRHQRSPTSCSRPRTRPGRPTTTTAATASTSAAPAAIPAAPTRSATTARSPRATASPEDLVFNAEYPMVRWLERNGYDVSYIERHRHGPRPARNCSSTASSCRSATTSTGRARSAPTSKPRARAGVHLAFFSGNEVFWKTRWEPSVDGSEHAASHAGLVQGNARQRDDRSGGRPTWTGTWRDPRFSPPADGGRPENALTGQLFRVNDGNTTSITVPVGRRQDAVLAQYDRRHPRGRRDRDAAQRHARLRMGRGAATIRSRRPGLIRLSSTTRSVNSMLLDNGSTYGAGTATHNLTLYRHPSGALVFGAGTVQWSWGLDNNHDRGNTAADVRMKQATVNLFADMGAQPDTLEAGPGRRHAVERRARADLDDHVAGAGASIQRRHARSPSPAPRSRPAAASSPASKCRPTAARPGPAPRAPRAGRFAWTVSGSGTVNIKARAFDDSGNMETPRRERDAITVTAGQACPCTIWAPTTVPPAPVDDGDPRAVELGTRFRSDIDGYITGIRFYKARRQHRHAHRRAVDQHRHAARHGDLHRRNGVGLAAGELPERRSRSPPTRPTSCRITRRTGTTPAPTTSSRTARRPSAAARPARRRRRRQRRVSLRRRRRRSPPTPTRRRLLGRRRLQHRSAARHDAADDHLGVPGRRASTGVDPATTVTATFSEAMDPATISSSTTGGEGGAALGTFELRDPSNNLVNATVTYDPVTRVATLDPRSALALSTTYTAIVKGGATDPRVKDLAGNALAATATWTFTTAAAPPPPPTCPCTIWAPTTVPAKIDDGDPNSDRARHAVPIRRRRLHHRRALLQGGRRTPARTSRSCGPIPARCSARATFTGETASGWQETAFPTPIAISANTTYVISYHANNGHYSSQAQLLRDRGVDQRPAARAAGRRRRRQRRLSVRQRARSRRRPSSRRATSSTSCSTRRTVRTRRRRW